MKAEQKKVVTEERFIVLTMTEEEARMTSDAAWGARGLCHGLYDTVLYKLAVELSRMIGK